MEPNKAFVIEFFEDNPRKKHTQTLNSTTTTPESSALNAQLEKTKRSPTSAVPPTQKYTIPLKGESASPGPQRAGSLRREKTQEHINTSFSSRSSASVKPFGSVGRRSKFAQEYAAEFLKQKWETSSASLEKKTNLSTTVKSEVVLECQSSSPPPSVPYQPLTSSPVHKPIPFKAPVMPLVSHDPEVQSPVLSSRCEEEDSLSDAGTYTIEADVQDKELEEARFKIDQVRGPRGESLRGISESHGESSSQSAQSEHRLLHLVHSNHCLPAMLFFPDRSLVFLNALGDLTRLKQKPHQHLDLLLFRAEVSLGRVTVVR